MLTIASFWKFSTAAIKEVVCLLTKIKLLSSSPKMCNIFKLEVLVLLVLCFQAYGHGEVWCVYQNENFCNGCTKNLSADLKEPIFVDKSNIIFYFCSSSIKFNSGKIFFDKSVNVSISSAVNHTEVTCKRDSGLHLRNLIDVVLTSIALNECGTSLKLQSFGQNVSTSVLIENSTNITLDRVSIHNSNGSGLVMLDNKGTITITNSTFTKCFLKSKEFHVGGVHISFSSCGWKVFELLDDRNLTCMNRVVIEDTYLTISGSRFTDNNIEKLKIRGGGLSIFLHSNSTRNKIAISNCVFHNNAAKYGGGLYILFEQDPKENKIQIQNSIFEDNKSIYTGGGANVWYFFSDDFSPTTNVVEFLGCEFYNNNANKGGGGIGVLFSPSKTTDMAMKNTICFVDCKWNSNTAKLGAAVDIVPYEGVNVHKRQFDLFKIKFTNSDISNNSHTKSMTETSGAMFIQELDVTFGGNTTFTNNTGTSLYIASSTITFEAMSHVRFNNNTAIHGSALNMIGASTININDYSTFIFSENTACAGSAILQVSNNPHDRTFSRLCFMKYIGNKPLDERKINFILMITKLSVKILEILYM